MTYQVIYSNPFYGGFEKAEFEATTQELCEAYIAKRCDGTLLELSDFYIKSKPGIIEDETV